MIGSIFKWIRETKVVQWIQKAIQNHILSFIILSFPVSLLKREQLTDEMINDPRYLLWETEEGLFEVEDLYSNETANAEVFASERDVSFYIFTKISPLDGKLCNVLMIIEWFSEIITYIRDNNLQVYK